MTTREQVRTALVNKIEALKSTFSTYTLLVEYDNLVTVNRATQSNPFLCVTIVYQDGYQIDLAANPSHRVLGTIVIEANVKEGSGTSRANLLLEHFYPSIHMKDNLPPLRTYAAKFASRSAKDGWAVQAALIPFWYDSMP